MKHKWVEIFGMNPSTEALDKTAGEMTLGWALYLNWPVAKGKSILALCIELYDFKDAFLIAIQLWIALIVYQKRDP